MNRIIEVRAGNELKKIFEFTMPSCVIGSSELVDLRLNYPTVSRQHAQIRQLEGLIYFKDLGSRNGSFINTDNTSTRLSENEIPWHMDEQIIIGPYSLSWNAKKSIRDNPETVSDFIQKTTDYFYKKLSENPTQANEMLEAYLKNESPSHWDEDKRNEIHSLVINEFYGDGPLTQLLLRPDCKEILINDYNLIFCDTGNGLDKTNLSFFRRSTFEAWAMRIAQKHGRRLDLQNPICEATLEDGARFHAVLSPISNKSLSVAIRRFGSAPLNEDQALATGWISSDALKILKNSIHEKKNILISGGTSSGKTSLLNFLCTYLNPQERVITIEDTVELSPPVENLVQLQSRTPNSDGVGQITLRQLIQCALRMRPDRIIVGECRGDEVLEMLQALNTGHPGSLSTIHANSTREAFERLELLVLLGAKNLSTDSIKKWISSSLQLVVQVERCENGKRQIAEILEKNKKNEWITVYAQQPS